MKPTRLVLLTSLFLVLPTYSATVRNLEFDANGVLPSAAPDIDLDINPALAEASVFSVTNGLLRQRTFGTNGSASYSWPDSGLFLGTLDPALDFTMEARLRVLRIEGIGGAHFQAFNDSHQYAAFFTAAGIQIRTNGSGFALISVSVTNYHTYRLEAPGNTELFRLFVDGTNMFEGHASLVTGFNGFSWGDDNAQPGNGADVDWDYIRVSQLDPDTDCVQPPEGLISEWKAEGNANDTWNTNHGTLRNGVTFTPGRVGQAFNFAGTGDFVSISDSPSLDLTAPFSLAVWVLVDEVQFSAYRSIIWKGDPVNASSFAGSPYTLGIGVGGTVVFAIATTNTYSSLLSTNRLAPNAWCHIVGVVDNSQWRLYMNGVLEATQPLPIFSSYNSPHDLLVGGTNPQFTQPFRGKLDELAIFNRALTSNEIAAIYAAGSAGICGPDQVPTVAVRLEPASDSGASNNDNLTTNTTPRFDVTNNRPGDIQFFYSGSTNADEVRSNLDVGTHVFTTLILTDGVHTVRARLVPLSGNPVQSSIAVTIDTRGPRVIASMPQAGALSDVLDQLEVTFDSAIEPATLNPADATLAGPFGMFNATSIVGLSTNRFLLTFPAQRIDGSYTFTLGPDVADLAGNLLDQDGDGINGEPSQDVLTAHFTLTLPDLSITQISASPTASAGQIIPVSWIITNQGSVTAIAPWLNTVTLADDANGSGSQTLASVPATVSIIPHSSLTETSFVVIPAGMFGQKFLRVTADSNGQVPETNEANNASTPLPIQIVGPDLLVESVMMRPLSPQFGDLVDIIWTVRNAGDGPALAPWSDRIQLSTDTIVGSDTLLLTRGASDVIPLAAGNAYTRTQSVTLPLGSGFLAGNYYVLAQSDIANQVAELNEFNNSLFSGPIGITNPPLPDLAVASILSPTNGFAGHPVTLTWVVTNQGAATAIGPWSDTVLLATNAQGSNATALATFSYSTNLAAGTSLARSGAVMLPSTAFGDLFFVIQTDSGTNVFENVNETNNTAVSAIRIHIQSPDLIVTDLQAPTNTLADRFIEVTWMVENRSEAPAAGSWVDQVVLTGLGGTNLVLGSFPFSEGLAAGQSVTRIQAVSIPRATVINGDYRIVVTTDAANSLSEGLNETNNTFVSAQLIHVTRNPLPDLVVDSIDAATNAFGGQTLTVRWIERNTGQAATDTPVWYDQLVLAPSPLGADAIGHAEAANVSFLDTNDSYVGSVNITVPPTAFGTLYLVLKADSDNTVQEEIETNNITSKPIEIILLPYPDLQVANVRSLHESFSGQSIPVTYTVENRAGASVPAGRSSWTDTIYLSSDQNFGSDIVIGSLRHTGILTNGESYTVSNLMVMLPRNVSGTNFIFVATDTANEVFEYLFEINNANEDTNGIVITRIPGSDLVLNSVSSTPNVLAGQPVSVTWNVSNEGAGDTGASLWYDSVYASADAVLDGSDTLVGQVYHAGPLNPGDNYSASLIYTSSVCASGPLYFFVVTDSYRNVDEYDSGGETNNTNYTNRATQVVPVPAADLQLTSVSAPTSGDAGAPIRVTWSVRNASGSAAATGDWVDRVYLSQGSNFIPGYSTIIASFSHTGGLAAGSNYSSAADVLLPADTSGLYYVFVQADADNAVNECANEGNNARSSLDVLNVRPIPLPDLQIVSVTGPETTPSGQAITVYWTGTNTGPGHIFGSWVDYLYLSSSPISLAGATFLGSASSSGPLLAGMSYQGSATVQLPYRLSGTHYLIVYTDAQGSVGEGPNEQNNLTATPLQVTQTVLADLQTSGVSVTNSGVAGQNVTVSWSVTNTGLGPTERPTWTDYIFLSRDQVLDPGDTQLAYVPHSGALPIGQGYTQSQSVTLPRGLSGTYYIFVCADRNDVVLELDENNNCAQSPTPIQISLPPPVDLVVTSVSVPGPGTPGQSANFNWTVLNQGGNTVSGSWQDSVYISTNSTWDITAPLLGKVAHSGPLMPGDSYPGTLTAALPGVVPGQYHVIVRADILNNVRETNEVNNLGVSSGTFGIDIPELQLGVAWPSNLVQDAEHYYKVKTPSNETMLVSLDGAATNGLNELFTRFGAVPNRGQYDFLYDNPFQPDQHNIVPTTVAGTYYHLVRGESVPNPPEDYSIKAELLPFEILSVSPQRIGDNGQVTITLKGARFESGATVQLISNGNSLSAAKVTVLDSATVKAQFFLTNAPHGVYSLKLSSPEGANTGLTNAVTIETATGLQVELGSTANLFPRFGGSFRWAGLARNSGNVDIPYLTIAIPVDQGLQAVLTTPTDALPIRTDGQPFSAFTIRDLAPEEQRPFSFTVSGYNSPFTYSVVPNARTKEQYVSYLQANYEGLRRVMLATPGLSLPAEFSSVIGDPQSWWDLIQQNYVAMGLLDPAEGQSLLKRYRATKAEETPEDCFRDCKVAAAIQLAGVFALYAVCVGSSGGTLLGPCLYVLDIGIAVVDAEFARCICVCNRKGQLECGAEKLVCGSLAGYPCPRRSSDPNEVNGPAGYGNEAFIDVRRPLLYTIHFENLTNASAVARQIRISNHIDPNLDARSAHLNEIGIGSYRITVPDNHSFYQSRVQLGPEFNNLLGDISAGLDLQRGEVRWTLTAIDPATGEPPESAALGLLPPNNTNHVGEGYVTYTIRPKAGTPTGTLITNRASIIFDNNEPIDTNPWWNTIDGVPPVSAVAALPANSQPSFPVSWSGADDAGGSGLQSFDLYVSDNGGPFQLWQSAVTNTTATYDGVAGHNYAFHSVARDNAGNVEPPPATPDAQTTTTGNTPPTLAGIPDQITFVGQTLLITNSASDGDFPPQTLTFNLDPGAPPGATINSSNGVFRWTPAPAQASTTNVISVRVTDNGSPVLSTNRTFIVVVPDFLEPGFGTVIVRAGTSERIPITIFSSVGLNRLSIRLQLPPNLTGLALENVAPQFCSNSLEVLSATEAVIGLGTCPGLAVQGTQVVAYLRFTLPPGVSSAFASVRASEVIGTRPDGSIITGITLPGSRLVMVGDEPLLEAVFDSDHHPKLILYGQPGSNYTVESTPSLTSPWATVASFSMTNLFRPIGEAPTTNQTMFFRARTP